MFLDLGDAVEAFGLGFAVGEDVGTGAADLAVARERTARAYCRPVSDGGAGDPAEPTAAGVRAGLRVTLEWVFGDPSASGRTVTVVGLGQVGQRLARWLAAEGARLTVTDIDPAKASLAAEIGARWAEPDAVLEEPADVIVPAALGGILTAEVVRTLTCKAIVGPANNQLADDGVADLLRSRGILWAPDFAVNAGGMIVVGLVEMLGWQPRRRRPTCRGNRGHGSRDLPTLRGR